MKEIIPTLEELETKIHLIRGHRVMIDSDLAELYGVTTTRLNQQVNRNIKRFPEDFMITLTPPEKAEVVAKCNNLRKLKFSPVMPKAFTEHGTIMLASVLNSAIAVQASLQVVRAFVRLRAILSTHKELAVKMEELEIKLRKHDSRFKKHGSRIKVLFETIWQLMNRPKSSIGFNR